MKKDGRAHDRKTKETIRMMAVERILGGEDVAVVMSSYGLSRTTGYKWLARVRESGRGINCLAARKGSGRPPKLTRSQRSQVFRWINGRTPRQNGLDVNLWTRAVIVNLIAQKFNVHLGLIAVGNLLAKLGLTPQKPKKRSVERNESDVVIWKNQTWPALIKMLHGNTRKVQHIVFIDSCWHPLLKERGRSVDIPQ